MKIEAVVKLWACIKASSYVKNCDGCSKLADCYEACVEIESILRRELLGEKEKA